MPILPERSCAPRQEANKADLGATALPLNLGEKDRRDPVLRNGATAGTTWWTKQTRILWISAAPEIEIRKGTSTRATR